MADHDNGAMVRLAATIARSRYEEDGGTLLGGIHPETIMEMALAAKREVDRLRAELLASEDFDRVVRDHLDARSDEPTLDAIRRLRAENARLREAMPTLKELYALKQVSTEELQAELHRRKAEERAKLRKRDVKFHYKVDPHYTGCGLYDDVQCIILFASKEHVTCPGCLDWIRERRI